MTDDEPKICESVRLWRLNSMEGLRLMGTDASLAADPEHLDAIQGRKAELDALKARENAVRSRFNRIFKANLPQAKP